jgi:hypothetical protein
VEQDAARQAAHRAGDLRDGDLQPGRRDQLSDKIGRLKQGLHGDVLVTTNRVDDPYRNLVESIERDVQLVAINGQPFYGTTKLMKATGADRAEPINVGRLRRSVQLVYPDVPEADMSWQAVLKDLADAIADPLKRYFELEKQHGNPDPEKRPLWLMTDKPWTTRRSRGGRSRSCPRSCASRRWTRSCTTSSTSTPSRPARCTAGCSTASATTTSRAARSSEP